LPAKDDLRVVLSAEVDFCKPDSLGIRMWPNVYDLADDYSTSPHKLRRLLPRRGQRGRFDQCMARSAERFSHILLLQPAGGSPERLEGAHRSASVLHVHEHVGIGVAVRPNHAAKPVVCVEVVAKLGTQRRLLGVQ
jgi:hypothetical protein